MSDGSSRIDRITSNGDITEFRVNVTSGVFFELTSGADGNLWFVEREMGKIGRLTPAGAPTEYDVHTTRLLPSPQDSPNMLIPSVRDTLTVGANGDAWFMAGSAGALTLGKRAASSGELSTFTELFPLEGYGSITLDARGFPWFTDARTDLTPLTIGRVDGTAVQRFHVACPSTAESSAARKVAVVATDSGAVLWFTEPRYATLLRVDAATGRSTCFHAFGDLSTLGVRGYPDRIAPAPDGSV